MACAEDVDDDLRMKVLNARQKGLRCFKAIVIGSQKRVLALAHEVIEDPTETLDEEFVRAMAETVEDKSPCLLLFRTDQRENIDGCRWLLIIWIPDGSSQIERSIVVRSRNLLCQLVPHPYFLREYFVGNRKKLTLAAARGATAPSVAVEKVDASPALNCNAAPVLPDSFNRSSVLNDLLGRFASKQDPCVRLRLNSVGPQKSAKAGLANIVRSASAASKLEHPNMPVLDCQVCEARSPAQLTGVLSSYSCFFAMHLRDAILFLFWCPEGRGAGPRDCARSVDDARHAVLKATVLNTLLDFFPGKKPRVIQIEAREQQEILEGASVAAARCSSMDSDDRSTSLGSLLTPAANVPCAMGFPERPVPPHRGGTKAHTITSCSGNAGTSGGASRDRPDLHHRNSESNLRIGTRFHDAGLRRQSRGY